MLERIPPTEGCDNADRHPASGCPAVSFPSSTFIQGQAREVVSSVVQNRASARLALKEKKSVFYLDRSRTCARRLPASCPESIAGRDARTEPPRVRALVRLLGARIGADRTNLDKLRASLNKTTKFNCGLVRIFPEAPRASGDSIRFAIEGFSRSSGRYGENQKSPRRLSEKNYYGVRAHFVPSARLCRVFLYLSLQCKAR
jgi:hypothetical protein